MSDREKRVRELIELKELQDKLERDAKNDEGKIKEKLQCLKRIDELLKDADLRDYVNLSTKEMNDKFKHELDTSSKSPNPLYLSPDLDTMIQEYKKRFLSENVYRPGYSEPVILDGKLSLHFPSEEAEVAFDLEMAAKGLKFDVIDRKTNMVIAYSDGKTLYHGPKGEKTPRVFNKGDSYYSAPSEETLKHDDLRLSPKRT